LQERYPTLVKIIFYCNFFFHILDRWTT
jgi:hypothetical protein